MKTREPSDVMSVGEAAAYWHVHPRTVVRWIAQGRLSVAFRTLGGHRRLAREAVVAARDEAVEEPVVHGPVTVAGIAFQVCGQCSRAAGEPVAWADCRAGQ